MTVDIDGSPRVLSVTNHSLLHTICMYVCLYVINNKQKQSCAFHNVYRSITRFNET